MSHSPYQVTLTNDKGFTFVTELGREYLVYFDNSGVIIPDPNINKFIYYFGFSCKPPFKVFERNHDPRVGETIMFIIANFFAKYPKAILAYICSSENKQERQRHIVFGQWYNSSPLKDRYTMIKKRLEGNYCGIIYDKKHPKLDLIDASFIDFTFEKDELEERNIGLYSFDDEEDDWNV